MTDSHDDILILGGGVAGLACALYLLREGRGVRILEQGRVGSGASHGNCGTITPSHAPPLAGPGVIARALKWMTRPDAPLYIRPRVDPALADWLLRFALRCNRDDWWASARARAALLDASRGLIGTLVEEEGLDCRFEANPLWYVARDRRQFEHEVREAALLRTLGIESRVLDAAEVARCEPALRPGVAGAIEFAGDASLRPDRYVAELARVVRANGGLIEEDCRVLGIDHERGRVASVRTALGARRGGEVVLAAGAWSPTLSRGLGLNVPVQPGKGYSITYSRPALAPSRPLVLKGPQVCVTTWSDGFRLGSTMEFSGYDASLNRTRLDALVRAAREHLHEPVGPELREEWYGWRPMTYDDLPLLGRAPRWDNLWLATGHGMLGMSMSAATGRLLADLVTRRAPILDPSPYDPARFA
ncbi:FAD-dependent oxidoreductase [Coralloluteibacterium stylophorae]|uniref:FAD-dependent oxidoreductase n=2 Tax=Coralloluteibacterium stylophorae TaxID=1776034 RepID=A0A8J8B0V4_9GAMM|nr:FAD-dependent oxidoreductase [Coralloluteibacterium stylophorae]MBS7456457.1 FAD-dependent oxidoreductase [Coralloluteibacterium stylophorae]